MNNLLNPLFDLRPSAARLDAALLGFRLLAGFALLRVHGWDKIVHYREELLSIPDPFGMGPEMSLGIAIFSDVFCAGLVMLGLFTRLATLPVLGTTLVGLLVVHGGDPWPEKDAPLTYTTMYGLILLLGPGKYSLDSLWQGALRRTKAQPWAYET